jgi:hypothetical protein
MDPITVGAAALVVGLAAGYGLGRHVERRRKAGRTPEEIIAEAKAAAEAVAAKLKK